MVQVAPLMTIRPSAPAGLACWLNQRFPSAPGVTSIGWPVRKKAMFGDRAGRRHPADRSRCDDGALIGEPEGAVTGRRDRGRVRIGTETGGELVDRPGSRSAREDPPDRPRRALIGEPKVAIRRRAIPFGLLLAFRPVRNLVIVPAGVMRPIAGCVVEVAGFLPLSVNQRLPSAPSASAFGLLPSSRANTVIVPVGVIRPIAGAAGFVSVNQRFPSEPP